MTDHFLREGAKRGVFWLPANDPLMVEAARKARASLPRLRELFAAHPKDTLVKIPFDAGEGAHEIIWCELKSLEADAMEVEMADQPRRDRGKFGGRRRLSMEDLQDWYVEEPGGAIRGAYSLRAIAAHLQAHGIEISPEQAEQIARFAPED
jgi:hypothetical protein